MKQILILCTFLMLIFACKEIKRNETAMNRFIPETSVKKVIDSLVVQHGDNQKIRIEKGIAQAAALWNKNDGKIEDFEKFCLDNYIASEGQLDTLFIKLSRNFELLWGSFNKLSISMKEPMDLVGEELYPIDEVFGAYDPSAHLDDDFFANKIAFHVILNFPCYTLKEKTDLGPGWNRKQWAYARLGDVFTSRIPADLIQKFTEENTKADLYIANYNIYLGNLLNDKSEQLFPSDLKLIRVW